MTDKAMRVNEVIYNDLQVVKENEGRRGLGDTIAFLIRKYNRCKETEECLDKRGPKEEKDWFDKWFGEDENGTDE